MLHTMLVNVAVTSGLLAGMFQMASKPPMKVGLWEVTSSVKVEMTGMSGMHAHVVKVHSCVTADSWKEAFSQARERHECTLSHENMTATHYSFDISCPATNATGHGEMDFTDETAGHGTMHMAMDAGGRAMTADTTWESRYLGADCGSVEPGKAEVIQ